MCQNDVIFTENPSKITPPTPPRRCFSTPLRGVKHLDFDEKTSKSLGPPFKPYFPISSIFTENLDFPPGSP